MALFSPARLTCARILGQYATEANLQYLREELGLHRPASVRYLDWIAGVAQGDFGNSLVQKRPIAEIVGSRLGPSIYLAAFAFLISVPAAVLIGIWAGVRPDSLGDRIASTIGTVGISLPEFVTGLFLMIIIDDVPIVITAFRPSTVGVRNHVRGVTAHPLDILILRDAWLNK